MPELSLKQYQRHRDGLLRAIQAGLQAEPVYPPRSPKPDEAFLERLEALRNWRKVTGKQNNVKSDVILPRDVMFAIATRNPATMEQLGEVMVQLPWRHQQYGEAILRVLETY